MQPGRRATACRTMMRFEPLPLPMGASPRLPLPSTKYIVLGRRVTIWGTMTWPMGFLSGFGRFRAEQGVFEQIDRLILDRLELRREPHEPVARNARGVLQGLMVVAARLEEPADVARVARHVVGDDGAGRPLARGLKLDLGIGTGAELRPRRL